MINPFRQFGQWLGSRIQSILQPIRSAIERVVTPIAQHGLTQQGATTAEIVEALQTAGIDLTAQRLRMTSTEAVRMAGAVPEVRRLSAQNFFPRRLMVESDLKRPKLYRVFGKATHANLLTGETTEYWVSMYTDRVSTIGELTERFEAEYDLNRYDVTTVYTGVEIYAVQHNRYMPY